MEIWRIKFWKFSKNNEVKKEERINQENKKLNFLSWKFSKKLLKKFFQILKKFFLLFKNFFWNKKIRNKKILKNKNKSDKLKTIEENFEKFHEKYDKLFQIKKFIQEKTDVNKNKKIDNFKNFFNNIFKIIFFI